MSAALSQEQLYLHKNDPMINSVNVTLCATFYLMCKFYSEVRGQNILKNGQKWEKFEDVITCSSFSLPLANLRNNNSFLT